MGQHKPQEVSLESMLFLLIDDQLVVQQELSF
jgi:hypothetical protein